ncbi:hypothetical protein QJS66_05950 [Kocuria rhizophila]|nr:hypothetical protein QJS66_05950 [Kocuria rhizophila]
MEILDPIGEPLGPVRRATSPLRLPLPPGTLSTLWGDDERFVSSYLSAFPGYCAAGDSGYIDENGYVFVMGRADDVINVSGPPGSPRGRWSRW